MVNRRKLSVRELHRISIDQFKQSNKLPLVVVLDNIRSVYNVGSIFRTCDAFRVESIYLCGISAQPPQTELHKTALGAEDSVEWFYFKNTRDAVRQLHETQYAVFSVEQAEESIPLHTFKIEKSKKYAIVMGHEVKGVQQEVVDMSDGCIEIPQYGTKHSLNVANAASMVIWDLFKQFSF